MRTDPAKQDGYEITYIALTNSVRDLNRRWKAVFTLAAERADETPRPLSGGS
jgi:hypothetical protein